MPNFTRWIPRFWHSKLSTVGVVLTTLSGLILIGAIAADFALAGLNIYTTAFVYLIMPVFFVGGLLLIPIGLWLRRRADRKHGRPAPDGSVASVLGRPAIRRTLLVVSGATALNVIIVGVAGTKAVHYMETPEFCGQICHTIMEPEYRAYLHSPHSRVACVECHVGEGAAWAAKAKLNGLRQVWETARGTYSRPIHAPIDGMRTASETCSACHRPGARQGNRLFSRFHYAADAENSPQVNVLSLRLDGLDHATGRRTGIHWHADPEVEVRYEALDAKRGVVGRIEVFEKGKLVRTYLPPDGEEAGSEGSRVYEVRKMDCIDCHNRPTHRFDASPDRAIDLAFHENRLDARMPHLKALALPLLERVDRDREGLAKAFDEELAAAYAREHPDLEVEREAIAAAARQLAGIYERNIWPRMKIGWGTYPSHIGHGDGLRETQGCFRCHNEKHRTAGGRALTQDCDHCHEMLAQEEAPGDLDDALRTLLSSSKDD